jgi:hypothetical protein
MEHPDREDFGESSLGDAQGEPAEADLFDDPDGLDDELEELDDPEELD